MKRSLSSEALIDLPRPRLSHHPTRSDYQETSAARLWSQKRRHGTQKL